MSAARQFTAIDLFSGAGGISLGLRAAGYEVLLANDFNPGASCSYRRNFPEHIFIQRDVREVEESEILSAAGLAPGELDLLMGGPPCQGFSILGARVVHDERNDL